MGGRQSRLILTWKYKDRVHTVIVEAGETNLEKALGVFLEELRKGRVRSIETLKLDNATDPYYTMSDERYQMLLTLLRNNQSPTPVAIKKNVGENMHLSIEQIYELIRAMHSRQTKLALVDFDATNYQEAVNLCLTPEQEKQVGTVKEGIIEAYLHKSYRLLVITPSENKSLVIGFIMYDPVSPLTTPKGNVAIHKFLIGCEYQNRGYGEEAMRLFINKAARIIPRPRLVELRTNADNVAAVKMYKNVGFIMAPDDEPNVLTGIYVLN